MPNKCCNLNDINDVKTAGNGINEQDCLVCPTCGNKIYELTSLRCPRCFSSLIRPGGCGSNCGKCGAK